MHPASRQLAPPVLRGRDELCFTHRQVVANEAKQKPKRSPNPEYIRPLNLAPEITTMTLACNPPGFRSNFLPAARQLRVFARDFQRRCPRPMITRACFRGGVSIRSLLVHIPHGCGSLRTGDARSCPVSSAPFPIDRESTLAWVPLAATPAHRAKESTSGHYLKYVSRLSGLPLQISPKGSRKQRLRALDHSCESCYAPAWTTVHGASSYVSWLPQSGVEVLKRAPVVTCSPGATHAIFNQPRGGINSTEAVHALALDQSLIPRPQPFRQRAARRDGPTTASEISISALRRSPCAWVDC